MTPEEFSKLRDVLGMDFPDATPGTFVGPQLYAMWLNMAERIVALEKAKAQK